ncbi:amino acid adenylation domain-containing protein [Micromonospora sp. NPDC051196]|uniref:non-ribosomal peptide synthetase/type I polyketide synthase n=1 Tax=Micromonospora sp. NPDC051196 TaxID=3155281 RepID=UPI003445C668
MNDVQPTDTGTRIAVIGMAGRFPDAPDLDTFWQNLVQGLESVRPQPVPEGANYVHAFAPLTDADCFDSDYFGISPREAMIIDPQHRLFLECAVEVLEDAGEDPERFSGRIGVYGGSSQTGHQEITRRLRAHLSNPTDLQLGLGAGMSFLTTRVAYHLGLRGPAVTVQTACSTSLVAVHQAAQALLAGDCDIALAGGASVHVPIPAGEYVEDGAMAGDGHCRAFDAAATGSVGGNAVGLVALKRLDDAVADGNTIHAVLLATAANNDGRLKIGFTAPSVDGQADVMRTALELADVPPESIGYVETHGTGTRLGDPIEVAALSAAYASARPRAKPGWIGSLKTNVGHSDAAAGVAGLIKTILALRHGQIPASLHFKTPNPQIDFDKSPFLVNARLRRWERTDGLPRRAGVNGLGVGGTNAHVVVEEAPTQPPTDPGRPYQLVLVSARSPRALAAARTALADRLRTATAEPDLADVAWTTQVGRRPNEFRQAFAVTDTAELIAALDAPNARPVERTAGERPVAMVFSGHGGQRIGMARELYEHEPAFRDAFDECADLFAVRTSLDLRELLFRSASGAEAEARLRPVTASHPAIFTVEVALAALWGAWGVTPTMVTGHSLGSYAAAYVAGVFSLADAVAVVAARSSLLSRLAPGAMVAVPLPEQEVRTYLPANVSVAAVNAPEQCVVSGPIKAIDEYVARLALRGVEVRRLHIPGAGHSDLVEPLLAEFGQVLSSIECHAPRIPFVSDTTGALAGPDELRDPGYWTRHMRDTVRFTTALATVLGADDMTVLEAGPGRSLSTLAALHPNFRSGQLAVSSMPHRSDLRSDGTHLLATAGRMWAAGHELDWSGLHSGTRRRRIPLPTYPFQRNRFRLDPDADQPVTVEPLAEPDVAPEPAERLATPTEVAVARAFQEVLGVPSAARSDGFFALGGDSLLATQLNTRLRAAYPIQISVREVFQAPTIAALAALIDEKTGTAPARTADAGPVPVERAGGAPLSFGQQRMWSIEQLGLAGISNVITAALRLRGDLDVPALGTAFSGVVARHESLRTRLLVGDGSEPVQVVDAPRPVHLDVVDLRTVPVGEREKRLDAEIDALSAVTFDLAADALLRVTLIRLGDREHVMVLLVHHIVSDGWSMGVLIREISELYAAAVERRTPQLDPLPVQYADFAVWQRAALDDVLERQLGYWRERLAGLTPLDVPGDRRRPAERSDAGAAYDFSAGADLVSGLRELATRTGTSLYMVLLAAFQVLLGRYARCDDVPVGTPVAGRSRTEVEGLIGFFVNTLVMRGDLRGDPTFVELLDRVKECALGAYEHQDVPFERLVEELAPGRDLSRTPLFQAMFILQNTGEQEWALPGVEVEDLPVAPGGSQFDLTLSAQESGGALHMQLIYSTDLYGPATAARLAGAFTTLLASVVAGPDRRLGDLEILTGTQRRELLDRAVCVPELPAATRCVHHLIEEQAAARPDATALVFDGEEVTYGDLNARANRLAHHLRACGAGPERVVAICLPRGPDYVTAMLAVLKAGAAYLPLDPSHPTVRLAAVVEEARAALVVAQAGTGIAADRVVLVDDEAAEVAARPDTDPGCVNGERDLAYVIYTSGSTGRPKGVMIEHRSLGLQVAAMREVYGLRPGEGLLQFASMVFDVATENVLVTLASGGRLVIRPQEWTPKSLAELAAAHDVAVTNFPPAVWAEVLAHLTPGALRLQIVGGEALPAAAVARHLEAGGIPVCNAYGPTEATITATIRRVEQPLESSAPYVPIGRPIAGTRVYVVDPAGHLVPDGVPGELLIGGRRVARGYLNRPALTAERFGPDPFSVEPDARIYRTGDLVRWLPDGELEFLGRTDDQIKVRGLRIEPGEIEPVLAAHPDVESAVVAAHETHLVAHVRVRPGGFLDVAALRAYLTARLPDYLVPDRFVALESIPLTAGGKIDRRALPAPDVAVGSPEGYLAPRTALERLVADIWSEVLGVPQVGLHDNFFDLGGHSLLATRVVLACRERGVHAVPRDLLKFPTVAGLAARITAPQSRTDGLPELIPLNRHTPGNRTLFCLPEIGGGTSAYVHLAGRLTGVFNVTGVDARGMGATGGDVGRLADQHWNTIRRAQVGPLLLAGWSYGGLLAVEVARRALADGRRPDGLIVIDSLLPSDDLRDRIRADLAVLRDVDGRLGADGPDDVRPVAPETAEELRSLGVANDVLLLGVGAVTGHLRLRIAHLTGMGNYQPRPIPCAVRFYEATECTWHTPSTDGWQAVTDGLEIVPVPGDHHSMLTRPQVDAIADDLVKLSESLNRRSF